MGWTTRIRIELTFGALSMRELADRCDLPTTGPLHPYIHQMHFKTKELVVIKRPGQPKRYALRRQHTGLSEHWR